MLRKLISILLVFLFSMPLTVQAESVSDPMEVTGCWLDSWSGRAQLTITFDGKQHKAVIRWADSASAHLEWTITGLFENGILKDENSMKRYVAYDENRNEDATILYADAPAALTLTGSAITWTDSESMGAECRFERYPDIDYRDVYNAKRYAHLYVTDIYPDGTGSLIYVQGTLGTVHENSSVSGFDLRDTLTLIMPAGSDCLLPASLSDSFSLEPISDPADWFAARSGDSGSGFYALFTMNESGQLTRLVYNEDQPAAPELPAEEEILTSSAAAPVMIVPAPPSRK